MSISVEINYAREPDLSVEDYRRVLVESGLAAIRPVDDTARLKAMIDNANLIVTARRDGALLGVARCITDFAWVCYLSDLAVSKAAQGLGLGKALIAATRRELGPQASLVLISVPDAVGFYERIGMAREPNGFFIRREC